jgi:hypothetical protein
VAGASYFGAATLTREMAITESQNRMATDGALRGAAALWGLGYAFDVPADGKAAGIFMGGIGGTAAGLYFGRHATPAQIEAGSFASTAAALTAGGITAVMLNRDENDLSNDEGRTVVGTMVAAGVVGYPLGLVYPRMVSYNVTAGDVNTLWASGALGTMLAGTAIANGDHEGRTVMTALTLGFLGGLVAGDRLLVKRFDHTRAEAAMVNLGAGAGALMGAGVFVLVDKDRENDALALALSAAGGVAGIAASEYFLATKGDAGRLSSRLQFSPSGLALAASRAPGRHAILTFAF